MHIHTQTSRSRPDTTCRSFLPSSDLARQFPGETYIANQGDISGDHPAMPISLRNNGSTRDDPRYRLAGRSRYRLLLLTVVSISLFGLGCLTYRHGPVTSSTALSISNAGRGIRIAVYEGSGFHDGELFRAVHRLKGGIDPPSTASSPSRSRICCYVVPTHDRYFVYIADQFPLRNVPNLQT